MEEVGHCFGGAGMTLSIGCGTNRVLTRHVIKLGIFVRTEIGVEVILGSTIIII